MILLPKYKGRKIGVMGLGLSGEATVASLCASGAEVFAWDEKPQNVEACQDRNSDATYNDFRKWPWKEINTLVLSPGIALSFPQPHAVVDIAMVYGCEIIGDIELLMQAQTQSRFVGITGTNGKSTTTALIGHLLESVGAEVQVGGNIGKAALSLDPLDKNGIYVLEMSSYQIELLQRGTFDVAILLNITPDHLDRHGGIEGYVAAKRRIFDGMAKRDTAIISRDDAHCRDIYKNLKAGKNLYSWQDSKPTFIPLTLKDACPIDLSDVQNLQGEHNRQNVMAALAACQALGFSIDKLEKGVRSFAGLAHRMQPIATHQEVLFVNDSKATNAEATSKALDTYDSIYWILGGVAKDGGIDTLVDYFPKIAKAYVIGQAAPEFAKLLRNHKVKLEKAVTMDKAVAMAADDAFKAGKGVVLLSPACASFDQYANFEKRGEHFTTLAHQMIAAKPAKSKAKHDG